MTKEAFEDNYFWVEDEDGEATVIVDDLTLIEGCLLYTSRCV